MRDLVQKLPSSNSHDGSTSDETIAAVLATLNEVIKKNAEFSRTLLEAGGVERLVYISKQRVRYSSRVVKFASQVSIEGIFCWMPAPWIFKLFILETQF